MKLQQLCSRAWKGQWSFTTTQGTGTQSPLRWSPLMGYSSLVSYHLQLARMVVSLQRRWWQGCNEENWKDQFFDTLPYEIEHPNRKDRAWIELTASESDKPSVLCLFVSYLSSCQGRKLQWCLYVGLWVLIRLGFQFIGSRCCLKPRLVVNLLLAWVPSSWDKLR